MLVCLCKGVRASTVAAVLEDGARTVDEVGRACGAGTDCGGCRGHIEEMVREHLQGQSGTHPASGLVRARRKSGVRAA